MNYHQSNAFSKIFQILFIICSTFLFFFSFRSASTILGGVSRYLSLHLKTEEEFSLESCFVLSKIHGSSLIPSSHNCFRLWEFFSPIRSISGVFSVWFSGAHHLKIIHFRCHLSFSKSYRCIIQVWSNQLRISSFTCIYILSSIFVFFFSNSTRWIVPLLLSFSILTVVRSRFHFLRYHINSFVVSKSYWWFIEGLFKLTLYLS